MLGPSSIRKGVLLALLFFPELLSGQPRPWETIGPEGGSVGPLIQSPSDPSVLIAVDQGNMWDWHLLNVFKSTDYGETWRCAGSIFPSYVDNMFFSRTDPSVVYGYTWDSLFQSTDGGQTWLRRQREAGHRFGDFIPDPLDPALIHAAGIESFDPNSGQGHPAYIRWMPATSTWISKPLSLSRGHCIAIEVERGDPQNIYLYGFVESGNLQLGQLWRSRDGGNTFSVSIFTDDYITHFATDPSKPGRVVAVSSSQIFVSTDYGVSWTRSPQDTLYPGSVAAADGLVYVSNQQWGGVHVSTDGLHYSLLPGSQPATRPGWSVPHALCIGSPAPHTIVSANYLGIIKSTDGGATWKACNRGLSLGRISALRYTSGSPATLLAARAGLALFRSSTSAATPVLWERMPDFYACTNLSDLAVLPTDPQIIYAMEGGT